MEDEKTIDTMLDGLDNAPPVLKGLTSSELGICVGVLVAIHIPLWAIVTLFFDVIPIYLALPIGMGTGGVHTYFFSAKVAILKKGRPSYLMWGELFKRWQIEGISIFGLGKIKVSIGPKFISTQVWDNCSKEE